MNLALAFDEFQHLHDARDGMELEYRRDEIASEMTSMFDALRACQAQAEQLVLQVCSMKMHGSIENMAHSLSTELAVLTARAQSVTQYF